MFMKKRNFLKTLGSLSLAPLAMHVPSSANAMNVSPHLSTMSDDEIWSTVRAQYDLKPDYINLESGYYNIIPQPTMQKYLKQVQMVNREGSYYMRTRRFKEKEEVTQKLAEFVGCSSEELVITRNTTESLDLIIAGYPWEKGDEAIYAKQDYGAMKVMFEQIAKRHGVVNKIVSVPNHPKSDEEIVALYEGQITSRTRLIMVCHIVNITGQILPIKKICEMAHRHGVEVMVDGAHAVGHFDFEISSFDCDYYGSSLHKWLATPLGAGLLYVNKRNTAKIWPLLGDYTKDLNDIRRLNHIGTHPVHTDLAILNAIDYHHWIGTERKENRLRFLQRYWSDALRDVPNVVVNTPVDSHRSCGIANVGVTTMSPAEMADRLLKDHHVFTVAIDYANVQGCRISPNVFTTTAELDQFIAAIKTLAAS